jgi:hypothetical protein
MRLVLPTVFFSNKRRVLRRFIKTNRVLLTSYLKNTEHTDRKTKNKHNRTRIWKELRSPYN